MINYNNLSWLKSDKVDKPPVIKVKSPKLDKMLSVLFAPSPVTGFPQSTYSILLGKQTDPEVRRYIEDFMQQTNVQRESADLSDDALFATAERRGDSVEDYYNRLRDFAIRSRRGDLEKVARERQREEEKKIIESWNT